VNFAYNPYFEVERRKYRFRILNGSVSRFFKIAFAYGGAAQPMIQIANDGNLLPNPVTVQALDVLGVAERYDIVIDFSNPDYKVGDMLYLVNLAEHEDGRGIKDIVSLSEALAGNSDDPCVGRFLQFRIVRDPAKPDVSRVPNTLVPNPDLTQIPVARERTFVFGDGAKQPSRDPNTAFIGPWGIETDDSDKLAADYNRVSAAPTYGTREIWHLVNDGGGWDHPVHIHFEEGQVLARNGSAANVPAWERGRKDVYRLHPEGTVSVSIQFRDWGGMFMEHCHNTIHEDNAMLLRWEVGGTGAPVLRPLPTPVPTPQGVMFEDSYDLQNGQ